VARIIDTGWIVDNVRGLMNEHGLGDWHFAFDQAKRRFGMCSYRNKTIYLSEPLCLANDWEQIKDTALHEIAHALCPGHGHDYTWKRMAASIGADPTARYSDEDVQSVGDHTYEGRCGNCGNTFYRYRRSSRMFTLSCGRCVRENNGYDDRWKIVWYKVK
jgi:predicted SprT family Zn-dependent metalloprotease